MFIPDDDLEQAIEENAKGPKRAKGDSVEIEHHNPKDQTEILRLLASKKAVKKKGAGLVFKKIISPGTT